MCRAASRNDVKTIELCLELGVGIDCGDYDQVCGAAVVRVLTFAESQGQQFQTFADMVAYVTAAQYPLQLLNDVHT